MQKQVLLTLAGVASTLRARERCYMTPLAWNTLDEAAVYIAENTGAEWTNKDVLNAAINYPISKHTNLTFLQVAFPLETEFGYYVFDIDIAGPHSFRRQFSANWQSIRLRNFDVGDLLIHSKVKLSTAGCNEDGSTTSEDEFVLIEPVQGSHIATLDMVGIKQCDLSEFAEAIVFAAAIKAAIKGDVPEHKKALNEGDEYTTKYLELTYLVKEKFWVNHDKNRPPKKADVIAFMKSQMPEISTNMAKAIDTLLRSPDSQKGGNKKLNNS